MLTVWSLLGRKETPFVYGQKAFLYPRNKALRICEIPLGHCHTPAAFETATLCQGPRARAGVWHHDAAMPISHSFPSEGQAGDTGLNLLRSVTLGRKKHCFCRGFSFCRNSGIRGLSGTRRPHRRGYAGGAKRFSLSHPARARRPCRRTALARWKYSQKPAILPTDKERLRKAGGMYYYETF